MHIDLKAFIDEIVSLIFSSSKTEQAKKSEPSLICSFNSSIILKYPDFSTSASVNLTELEPMSITPILSISFPLYLFKI